MWLVVRMAKFIDAIHEHHSYRIRCTVPAGAGAPALLTAALAPYGPGNPVQLGPVTVQPGTTGELSGTAPDDERWQSIQIKATPASQSAGATLEFLGGVLAPPPEKLSQTNDEFWVAIIAAP